MKRLNTILTICIAGLITSLSACRDVVDIDLDQGETLLVVEGNIYDTPGPYTVRLNLTAPYFANEALPPAEGATVVITDSEGAVDTLTEVSAGIYETNTLQGQPGNTYTLEVAYNGEAFTAMSTLNPVPPIDSVYYTFEEEEVFQEEGYYLYYYGPELEGAGDYYRMKIYTNGELWADPFDLIFFPDRFVNGNYLFDLQLNFEPLEQEDEFTLELLSISEEHYYFLTELQEQTTNGGLFSDPPANIRTNILNNDPNGMSAVGWFLAAGIRSVSGQVTGEEGVVYP